MSRKSGKQDVPKSNPEDEILYSTMGGTKPLQDTLLNTPVTLRPQRVRRGAGLNGLVAGFAYNNLGQQPDTTAAMPAHNEALQMFQTAPPEGIAIEETGEIYNAARDEYYYPQTQTCRYGPPPQYDASTGTYHGWANECYYATWMEYFHSWDPQPANQQSGSHQGHGTDRSDLSGNNSSSSSSHQQRGNHK